MFVGGLSCPISEDELKQYFSIFGEIVYVKIPPGKGCGFVQYVSRHAAELAIEQMNGYQIGSLRIRLSWGRTQQQQSRNRSSSMHPFDEDKGFMTVFNSNNFIDLNPVIAAASSSNATTSANSSSSGRHNTSSWSTDYHHIFAQ